MQEIEVKILDIDRKKIEEQLLSLGAKKVFDGLISGSIFDFKNHSIQSAKSFLRLRKVGNQSFLTFKKRISIEKTKHYEETETRVSDFETTLKILESLGLEAKDHLTKKRTSYQLDKVKFEFDKYLNEYEHIPEFLEIEAQNEDVLFEWTEKLGFKRDDCKPWSIVDVIKHYKK